MCNTGTAVVRHCAAELLSRDFLSRNGLDNCRASNEHLACVLYHVDEVCESWAVNSTARAGSHDNRDLRDNARGLCVAVEDAAVARESIDRLLDTRTARIVDADAGRAHLHRKIHDLPDLVCMLLTERAALNRKVLRKCIDKTTVDRAVARYNTLARELFLLLAEVGAAMANEHIKLDKAVLIEKQIQTLTRRKLALCVLLLDGLLAAAEHEMLFLLEHQLNFFLNCGHRIPPVYLPNPESTASRSAPRKGIFFSGRFSAILVLADLEENALRRFRMKERDLRAACTDTRLLVDHANALCHEVGNRVLNVVNAQSDVLDALAVLLNVLRDGAVRRRADEQLDLAAVRRRMECRRNLLLSNRLLVRAGNADNVRPEILSVFEILYGNADVIYSQNLEHWYILLVNRGVPGASSLH